MMQALHRQPLPGARTKTVVMVVQEFAVKSRLTVGWLRCCCSGGSSCVGAVAAEAVVASQCLEWGLPHALLPSGSGGGRRRERLAVG